MQNPTRTQTVAAPPSLVALALVLVGAPLSIVGLLAVFGIL